MGYDHHKVVSGLISDKDLCKVREAVCVQVEKIYDSCREKDCIENARVFFNENVQPIINRAINVKARRAEVIDVFADIEPVPFKRGFYTVDVKFFIRVTLDFFVPGGVGPSGTRIVTRHGLVMFDKKVILFGSEGKVKIFKSHFVNNGIDTPIRSRLQQDNEPISKVEAAEPIPLSARIEDIFEHCHEDEHCCEMISEELRGYLDEGVDTTEAEELGEMRQGRPRTRRVLVTLGLFSIIKLVRFVQLLIPAFDFCMPDKECIAATEENPCELFEAIDFPFDEFFPPQKFDFPGAVETEKKMREEFED